MDRTIRVLGLGNDLLADDGFGVDVARRLRSELPECVEVTSSIASGFALLDEVLGADRLLVIDTVTDGQGPPGTVQTFREASVAPGGSPHYVGLFETLDLGRALGLDVPGDLVILAVQAGDCLTIGGGMSPGVRAAIPQVMGLVKDQITEWESEANAISG